MGGKLGEKLTVKNLGPLKKATIEPRPLTVIIGPQASGKSLLAQGLYFFRGLDRHIARRYEKDKETNKTTPSAILKSILDSIRGVPFGYFANGTALLEYTDPAMDYDWSASVYYNNRAVRPNNNLKKFIIDLIEEWERAPRRLHLSHRKRHIFIPTERSTFTRLSGRATSVLFDNEIQPAPFIQFADYLENAKRIYSEYLDELYMGDDLYHLEYLLRCQLRALKGEAYVPKVGNQLWKWRVREQAETKSNNKESSKILPIEATASGQMEAWPFFVISAVYGVSNRNPAQFYFEEPETHLHPAAQLEVINAIAYLVNLGRTYVITTHSPFILYLINNLIMHYLTSSEKFVDNKVGLSPKDVAVYNIENGICRDIMDREDTKLIPPTELDKVADQLGAEFDALLDKLDRD